MIHGTRWKWWVWAVLCDPESVRSRVNDKFISTIHEDFISMVDTKKFT
jgi:hypothetical protein